MNTHFVRKWRFARGASLASAAITPAASKPALLGTAPEFVAIDMPNPAMTDARAEAGQTVAAPMGKAPIHIEFRRGPLHLNVALASRGRKGLPGLAERTSSGMLK